MRIARAALACAAVLAVGVVLVSGGSDADPHTPPALPGRPAPFLGTAVSGDGGLTAAVDAYGDVVDLRAPGPAGAALIDNPSARQSAGTVPTDTGIVPRVRIDGGGAVAMWRADWVTQHYLPGTNVVRTIARFGGTQMVMTTATEGESLAVMVRTLVDHGRKGSGEDSIPTLGVDVASELRCARERRAGQLDLLCRVRRAVPPVPAAAAGDGGIVAQACAHLVRSAAHDARRWLNRSRPLGADAPSAASESGSPGGTVPGWAESMYERSLLAIHALSSRATGAVAAGARDGWAYVWPRDAAIAALALAASGHRAEARQIARFLTDLDLSAAARFGESGAPVPGRAAQGDAAGWVDAAARVTGVPAPAKPFAWRDRADYQESSPGTYLGNALAAAETAAERARIAREFGTSRGLVRSAGDPGSGLDSAAAWAVRPFGLQALYPAAEKTLLRLVGQGTRYGITPGEGWTGGEDPWTAPTAWSAWALAGLATDRKTGVRDPRTNLPAVRAGGGPSRRSLRLRHAALALVADLRRASTPAGDLPERVGVQTGIPTSTTPLLWSSAFTVLALRELWP
ncbi:MAG TPA: glycoside hydrolase family 15 protein [Solirubrobacterales bacterium]